MPPPTASGSDNKPAHAANAEALARLCAKLEGMDYFQVLALRHDAESSEVKKAFHRASRAYHPDRFFRATDPALSARVSQVFKHITEAYYVLRDPVKRKKYLADITGPGREKKLRFTEATELETKQAMKKGREAEVGSHPKGRQLFKTAAGDFQASRWASAERNLRMALTYEPQNARYKEMLEQVLQKLHTERSASGDYFKIK